MRRFFVSAALAVLIIPPVPAPGQSSLRDRPGSELDARYNDLIDGWYRRYLRKPSGVYAAAAVSMLESGTSQETMLASILGSDEYYALVGGDDRRFVARLIADVTRRVPSPRETAYLLDRIRSEDRNQVASEYLSLHPEGLRVSASRPEPDHEYRRPYHHDYDHDYDRDRRDDRRDRDR